MPGKTTRDETIRDPPSERAFFSRPTDRPSVRACVRVRLVVCVCARESVYVCVRVCTGCCCWMNAMCLNGRNGSWKGARAIYLGPSSSTRSRHIRERAHANFQFPPTVTHPSGDPFEDVAADAGVDDRRRNTTIITSELERDPRVGREGLFSGARGPLPVPVTWATEWTLKSRCWRPVRRPPPLERIREDLLRAPPHQQRVSTRSPDVRTRSPITTARFSPAKNR